MLELKTTSLVSFSVLFYHRVEYSFVCTVSKCIDLLVFKGLSHKRTFFRIFFLKKFIFKHISQYKHKDIHPFWFFPQFQLSFKWTVKNL